MADSAGFIVVYPDGLDDTVHGNGNDEKGCDRDSRNRSTHCTMHCETKCFLESMFFETAPPSQDEYLRATENSRFWQ